MYGKCSLLLIFQGRFNVKSTGFKCVLCGCTEKASLADYISSGFWPGTPRNITYLFSTELLIRWYLLKHDIPSTSTGKFITTLQNFAAKTRNTVKFMILYAHPVSSINLFLSQRLPINKNQLNRASKEFEFFAHSVEESVKKRDKTYCKACGEEPLAGHIDGIMKLHRWSSAKG